MTLRILTPTLRDNHMHVTKKTLPGPAFLLSKEPSHSNSTATT